MSAWPDLTMGPITTWPGSRTPPEDRQRARFETALPFTLDQLDRELRHLRAIDVVMEVAIRHEDFRRDGKPRAHAKAEHPGVVLRFRAPQIKAEPLAYGTDRFTLWQDNLRAITLALHDLRRVERYGVASRGEQHSGFAQLPAGDVRGRALILEHGGAREALLATHPDHGGDPRDFRDVQAARGASE
jgi:hypothetical protein